MISFFKKCWEIVKEEFLKALDEFNYLEEFYDHLNNNFIFFIPKNKGANEKRNFRPISLLSSVYYPKFWHFV